jgi:hypothetical protein
MKKNSEEFPPQGVSAAGDRVVYNIPAVMEVPLIFSAANARQLAQQLIDAADWVDVEQLYGPAARVLLDRTGAKDLNGLLALSPDGTIGGLIEELRTNGHDTL